MRIARPRATTALPALILLASLGPTRAEELVFQAGDRVELPAEVRGDEVVLLGPDGPYHFRRDDFRSIAPSFDPRREWPSRRESALAGDASRRLEAVRWALMNGLPDEAEAMLRAASRSDPGHPPTARMVAVLDRLRSASPARTAAARADAYGGRWRVARGDYILLHHRHDPAEAADRVEQLERVTTSFYLLLTALGLEPEPPARPLVSYWFARRGPYLAALRAEGAGALSATRGYYHPAKAIVLTYDAIDDPTSRRRLAELARLREVVSRPDAPPISADRRPSDPDRLRLVLGLDRRALNLGTAAHETVHQLLACSGLAPRVEDFPLWLHEGFAAQFEVVRGGDWAGIGRVHPLRLADLPRRGPLPRLAPLLCDGGFGRGYRADRYAAAWSFVGYLLREHPARFAAFVDALGDTDRGPGPRSGRHVMIFREVFGPRLAAVESGWHESLRSHLHDVGPDSSPTRETTGEPPPHSD